MRFISMYDRPMDIVTCIVACIINEEECDLKIEILSQRFVSSVFFKWRNLARSTGKLNTMMSVT